MCGVTTKDKKRNIYIREQLGIVSTADKMRENRLKYYVHMRRKLSDAIVRRGEMINTSDTIRE